MRRLSFGLTISVGFLWLFAAGALTCANAESRSETGGPSLIAIPAFAASNSVLAEIASHAHRVVEERFAQAESCVVTDAPVAPAMYAEFPPAPDLSIWRSRRVRFLVLGQIGMRENGTLKLEARVFDVAGKTASGYQIIFSPNDWQRAANDLADDAVQVSCPPSSAK
jgi:hypothetical protein